ncbi:MAG: hypothetical protein JNN12_01490 [Bacteroidetes Order II. Incertae sedis bacterium]|nr:hypothetical protein [Bacteroidetes Order II. bacterium]
MTHFLLCIWFLAPFMAWGQSKRYHVCNYYGHEVRAEVLEGRFRMAKGVNQRAISLVTRILNASGLQQNFEIFADNTADNAYALIDTNSHKRLIGYNEGFMLDVEAGTRGGWAAMSIFAHEIGHHLSGHTLDFLGSRPDKELDADRFSGFILYKLGAQLEEAQEAISYIASEQGSNTHPPRSQRLQAIREGFFDAARKFPRSDSPQGVPEVKNPETQYKFRSGIGENYHYIGPLKNGKPHGHGKASYENGWMLTYEGEFVAGQRVGQARVLYRNGDRYEGAYQDDLRGGYGTYYWKNGDTYTGYHKNNKFNGQGKRTWKASGDVVEGNFLDDSIHGKATYRWGTGEVFMGEYRQGIIEGRGTKKLKNGSEYDGEWKNGKRHGYGTYRYADSTSYVGYFEHNLRQGVGTLYDKFGRKLASGRWVRDRLVR